VSASWSSPNSSLQSQHDTIARTGSTTYGSMDASNAHKQLWLAERIPMDPIVLDVLQIVLMLVIAIWPLRVLDVLGALGGVRIWRCAITCASDLVLDEYQRLNQIVVTMATTRRLQPSWHRESEAGQLCVGGSDSYLKSIATFAQGNPM